MPSAAASTSAVARAAMESGVARLKLDLADYTRRLEETVANL